MVHLCKLQLSGIRSYNPNTLNTLEFYSPLTLIVGANGSGKTTIIETLKYITCNELPQNTRGVAFIYDPKLLGTYDVKANIKLVFYNINNQKMTIQRTLQGIQKKSGLTQKSLETNLSVIQGNETINISNKLSTIDTQMGHFLGVSNALLQNIIFCHQEESNWFLSEPVNVKKKFDEIFNTTQYSKALDNIKSVRREMGSKIKIKMQELEFLMEKKMKKEKIKVTSYEQKQKLENLNFELEKLRKVSYSEQIEETKKAIEKENKNEVAYNRLLVEISMVEKDCIPSLDQCEFLENVLKIKAIEDKYRYLFLCNDLSFLGVDDSNIEFTYDWAVLYIQNCDFENKCNQFEQYVYKQNLRVEKYKNKVIESSSYLSKKEQTHQTIIKSIAKIKKYNDAIKSAQNEISKILDADNLNISLDECITLLNDNQAIKKTKLQINQLEDDVFKKNKEIAEIECYIKEKEARIKQNEKQLADYNDTAKKLTNDLRSIELEYKSMINIDEDESTLEEMKKEIHKKLAEEEAKYHANIKNNEKVAEINFQIKQKVDLEKSIHTTMKGIYNKICAIRMLAKNKELKDVLESFEIKTAFALKHRTFDEIVSDWDEFKAKLDEFFNAQIVCVEENERQKAILAAGLLKLKDLGIFATVGDLMNYKFESTAVNEYNIKIEEKQHTLSITKNAIVLFENFRKKGLERNICYLCHRKFDMEEKESYGDIISNILNNLKVKSSNCEQEHKKLLQAKSSIEERAALYAKINTVCNIIVDLGKYLFDEKYESMSLQDLILYLQTDEKKDLIEIRNITHEIDNAFTIIMYSIESYKLLEHINELEYVNLDEIQNSILRYKAKIEDIENKQNLIRKNMKLINMYKEREQINIQIDKLCLLADEAMTDIDMSSNLSHDAKNKLSIITTKLESHYEELKSLKLLFDNLRKEIDNKITNFNNYKYVIEQNKEWISQETKYVYDNLESNKENFMGDICSKEFMMDLDSEFASVQLKHKKLSEELEHEKAELSTYQDTFLYFKKTGEECKKYLVYLGNMETLTNLKSKLKLTNYEHLKELKKNLVQFETQQNEINNRIAMLMGEQKQVEIQYNRINAELNSEFIDAENKYIDCYIEVKTLDYIISDIEKCIKALDQSIVDFYSTKIEEINTILKDLWVRTYKGNDIDYISLKSETNDCKVYNYKLVMFKNGIELDLRGRSSAGQKMLVSLLTRLAICDAFCSTFNVLALDEPTTNLDKDNVESLAYTLQKILDDRKTSNFQLIIITHDEAFLETMNRHGCDDYYRIYKDSNGNSMITKESLYQ